MRNHTKNTLVWIGLAMLATVIRLLAARNAYPACGDAGHFVQHGVALANGVPGAMSTYWSQGMIAIAAAAVKLDLDPRYALQATTVVSGVAVVLLFLGAIWRLTRSRQLALTGGLILAVNPTMVQYSITGYSEMPYMMFLMGGVFVGLSRRLHGVLRFALAGVLIGVGGYFKGLDAAVAACGFGLFACFQGGARGRAQVLRAGIVPVAAFLLLLPLCIFTYIQAGSFTPGSKGGGNFAAGPNWADSKAVYAAEGIQLEGKTMAELIRKIPSRTMRNSRDAVRLVSGQIFTRGFRLGAFWGFLLIVGVGAALWKRRDGQALLPVCMLIIQVGLLCLVFVHHRILAPSLPWGVLLLLLAWRSIAPPSDFRKWSARGILAFYLAVNARYAMDAFANDFVWWRYANVQHCAEKLREYGGTDADVIMTYGPHMAVEFNRTNPLRTVEVPYGTLGQVEDIAHRKQVRFVVISDKFRSHWPVASLFEEGAVAPTNWILREELIFPEEEWTGWQGHPGERCRIYERLLPAETAQGT